MTGVAVLPPGFSLRGRGSCLPARLGSRLESKLTVCRLLKPQSLGYAQAVFIQGEHFGMGRD